MPVSLVPGPGEMLRVLPETILVVAGTLLMVMAAAHRRLRPPVFAYLSTGALGAATVAAAAGCASPGPAFSELLLVDGFASFFRVLIFVVGLLTVLSSCRFLERESAETGEYHALLLFSISGQSILVTANELMMVFLGLEISSIASYVLAGYLRDDRRASEAALKYFLLGSFATAFFLYGVAVVYGTTGATRLGAVREALAAGPGSAATPVALAAALLFVGLAFKVSAAPFQMWAPDVYQGAPAPVAAFLSAGPKAAAFAVFLRIFTDAFAPLGGQWEPLVWGSALASMTIGNFAALVQPNIKRMLGYSSVAHAGYVLVALAARSEAGVAAAMFYLVAYAFMNMGAFAVVSHLAGKGERFLAVEDFAGLGTRQPVTAALLTVFLLSLIGVPLTGGFFGKFCIFKAALDSHLVWLTILGLLNSAVAAYYYLRVLVMMYMREPGEAADAAEPLSGGLRAALVIPALGTLLLGVAPAWVLEVAGKASSFAQR